MMNDKCRVPLILLAAGESRRMGMPKQLLSYKGSSLIYHAANEAIASACDPIVVVLGANSDRIAPELNKLPVHIALNSQWQQGMSSSIAMGIKALLEISSGFEAIIIALADQPLITAKMYARLIEPYQRHQLKAVASTYNNTIGVPALFDRELLPELLKLDRRGGAKQILNEYSDRAFNLDLPEAAIDIDTASDYQRLLKYA